MQKQNKKSGFTLVETIVSCVILTAMIAFAIPSYNDYMERQIAKEGERILLSVLAAQKAFLIDNNLIEVEDISQTAISGINRTTVSGQEISELDLSVPVSENFNPPDGTVPSAATAYAGMITRNSANPYTLYITWDGQFNCSGTRCSKLKYSAPRLTSDFMRQ